MHSDLSYDLVTEITTAGHDNAARLSTFGQPGVSKHRRRHVNNTTMTLLNDDKANSHFN